MKLVAKYQTEDGKTFDSKSEAQQHENHNEALRQLGALLESSMKTGRAEAVLRHILLESESVSQIVASYRRKLPKVKQEKIAA